ncbi:hypothetical protein [Sphingopyxis sp. MWB1]|uniref:hypothetical protein n=1 Tax=Sphingopyxis sp. MWB1 TaxID=1537715 RepID=UPI0009DEA0B4|nr:hypothetical protein [Sphingopyxis sp. MWB1]
MLQIAIALLFTLAGGGAVMVILAMLASNAAPIWSSLIGEGAFPAYRTPQSGLAPNSLPPRRAPSNRRSPQAKKALPAAVLNCAA